MKKFNRYLTMALSAGMAVSVLAGCGSSSSSSGTSSADTASASAAASGSTAAAGDGTVDTSEEVELVMYVISDRPAGQDVVDENLNKLLKEKLNCTLKINYLSWAEQATKYPLLFSSGEEFDLAYTANWCNFYNLAQKGAFKNLDELWPTYAPKNFAKQSDNAKKQATVNGHYYCIPSLYPTYSEYEPVYRQDIMEGTDWDGKMETWEDIEEYLDIVKETHPEMEPVDVYQLGSEMDDSYFYSLGYRPVTGSQGGFLWYDPTLENPQVIPTFDLPETPEFLEMMSRWNEKGFYSKSALSDTDSTKFQNGKAALRPANFDQWQGFAVLHPEYNIDMAMLAKNVCHLPYIQDAMVISNTSKNPERALAFWDLLTSDQEVFDAYYYGVLGTTYELNDEGQYTMLDPDLYQTGAMWSARTAETNREQAGTPEIIAEDKQKLEEEIAANPAGENYTSFALDTSNIQSEYAACTNAQSQYWNPLELGYTDPVEGLQQYKDAMKAGGIDKVVEEVQREMDEYTASLKSGQ